MTVPVVGVDLGGTKIFGALVDPAGAGLDAVLQDAKSPTPAGGVDSILDAVEALRGELVELGFAVALSRMREHRDTARVVNRADGAVQLDARLAHVGIAVRADPTFVDFADRTGVSAFDQRASQMRACGRCGGSGQDLGRIELDAFVP